MAILVSGSLAYDQILNFNGRFADHIIADKIHTLSVSFLVESVEESFGGTAGNIAYSLMLLGETPTIIATAGSDFGTYEAWLKKNAVPTESIKIAPTDKTAFATIMTDLDDNQITAFYPGAMTIPYHAVPARQGSDLAIIAPGNMADMRDLAAYYRSEKIPFVYDPGQQIPALSAEDLKHGMEGAYAFISNDYEFALMSEKTGRTEASMFEHVGMIVTTLGNKGSRVATKKDGTIEVGTANPQVVDPTGAGDAYRAGFLAALRRGLPARTAAQLGSTVAAYAIEIKGTQTHTFTKEVLAARYRENYHEEINL
jgi:adenosine kinase